MDNIVDQLEEEHSEEKNEPREWPDGERPEWLPENFKTPEALLESYKHSQRKITEQGTELAATREQLAAYEAQLSEQEELVAQQRQAVDPAETMRLLAEQAQYQQPQYQPPNFAQVATAAAQQGAAQANIPEDVASEVNLLIDRDPQWSARLQAAMATGSSNAVASILESAAAVVTANRQSSRAMKLNGQTMTGGGSRPDAVEPEKDAWERIAAAGQGDYASLMRDRQS